MCKKKVREMKKLGVRWGSCHNTKHWVSQEASPSVVFIKDLEIVRSPKTTSDDVNLIEDENAKVDGTGSGFIWDNFGHIVTNHHVVAKLATDGSGIHCYLSSRHKRQWLLQGGKIVGVDPEYDLAVLKLTKEDVQACVR